LGISERQLAELGRYQNSDAFDTTERLVLDLAVAMTSTPADVSEELRETLLAHFSKTGFMELVSMIAWENHRARANRALGVREVGFSDNAFCALPEHRA
jgi:alkylhydroperoxidase family enzyme